MAEALRPLLALLSITLALLMFSAGLGSFAALGQSLWGDSARRARTRMETHWWADVRLGALHGLGMFVLAVVSQGRPLVALFALAVAGFGLACLWVGIPALVERLGERIHPSASRPLVYFVGASCLVWGCAIPYLGWSLLVVLVLGTYASGLASFLGRKAARAQDGNIAAT